MMELGGDIYKSVLESLPIGVYLVDQHRRILSWNSGAEKLTGYLRQEVVGRCCADGLLMHCDANNAIMCGDACPLEATMRDGRPREADLYLLHKDGQRVPVRVQAIPLRDEDGAVIGAAECFDVRVVLPTAVVPECGPEGISTDSVTELPDRGAILAQLPGALRNFEESRIPFGVLGIAIDNLDGLLQKNGRNAVEAVLYATGQTLRANVGPNDMVGRWSADRFVTVLAGCTAGTLAKAAGMLNRLASSEAIPWWGDRLSVTVSMGGTIVRAGDTPQSLVERAEEALDAGRTAGGGVLVVT
jgi:diguanylate cyclase (GGDEF)-like protein/PAS domain S-box-containing protein